VKEGVWWVGGSSCVGFRQKVACEIGTGDGSSGGSASDLDVAWEGWGGHGMGGVVRTWHGRVVRMRHVCGVESVHTHLMYIQEELVMFLHDEKSRYLRFLQFWLRLSAVLSVILKHLLRINFSM